MFKPKAAQTRKVLVPVKEPEKKGQLAQRHSSLSTPAQRLARDAAHDARTTSRLGAPLKKRTANKSPRPSINGHTNGVDSGSSSPRAQSLKRKRNGTPQTPDWGSDEGDEDADIGEDSRKQKRPVKNDSLEPDAKRHIWLNDAPVAAEDMEDLIHGADFTSGKHAATTGIKPDIYRSQFELGQDEDIPEVELQYPSAAPPERFQLVYPNDNSEYRPLVDIYESVEAILTHYFSPSRRESLLDPETGIPRRLKIAINHRDLSSFRDTLTEFNVLVKKSLADGTISSHLESQHTVPITLIERILERQTYDRTVAPHVAKLKVRKTELNNEKSKTYGEIKPRFAHDILRETKLRSDQVFIDLGSGVGNVVLQAALETGAEAHGIEIVDTPAACADAQQREFVARCRLWGIRPGAVSLHHGDFLANPAVDAVLRTADVVLCNNRVFEPALNDALVMKFLDCKEGCQIVSLESFVPEKWEIKQSNMHDVRNMLRTRELWYGSDRVSWAHEGGSWYVAIKDSEKIRRFIEDGR